jgi:hypothetical protein
MRPNPKKLNRLQLKTLAILQAMAQDQWLANPPDADGTVLIHSLPHAHGDHLHVGSTVVRARDATGLGNPNVMTALVRKGLVLGGIPGPPILTAEGLGYETGIAAEILHGAADHP